MEEEEAGHHPSCADDDVNKTPADTETLDFTRFNGHESYLKLRLSKSKILIKLESE